MGKAKELAATLTCRLRALLRFRKLGINIDNIEAEELWEILDADHSGEIDEDRRNLKTEQKGHRAGHRAGNIRLKKALKKKVQ